MNDLKFVEVGHPRHDLRELRVIDEREGTSRRKAGGPTNRKRLAPGFDLAYCITFPLGIHLERIRKQSGSRDTETPNRDKMFGWDKYFQVTISRHNRWGGI